MARTKKEDPMFEEQFLGIFENRDIIASNFQIAPELLDSMFIIQAEYEYEDYSGAAHVIYLKDKKLYEVHAYHCSCYGLEDKWDPEETVPEAALQQEWFANNEFLKFLSQHPEMLEPSQDLAVDGLTP